ncbi:MAG: GDP-mannose 4,6-dehydratase [Candidatus Omnitrophica bacterium]|nr:GDP-mannose 4,6-dehydratase [Candidatus Omnitrophota bacterium]
MRYLITGGCGFLGSNLASEVLKRGGELFLFDDLSRAGSSQNLEWLKTLGEFSFVLGDIRVNKDVERVVREIKPDVVFHLAGQVAMTTSLQDPRKDFEVNVVGSLNLLEALRIHAPDAIVIYSSTNKVYGDLENYEYIETRTRYEVSGLEHGFDELVGLDFRSPYGCSKGAADQYMLDYARNFGIKSIVFRHSSIYGGRQFSTYDQGWVGWFVGQALLAQDGRLEKPFTISGDGKQVRDVLFASDLIHCYFSAADAVENCSGKAFNIGGGMANSLSLLELFSILEQELNVTLTYQQLPWRANDQKVFVADIRKATREFHWQPQVNKRTGIQKMIRWVRENDGK